MIAKMCARGSGYLHNSCVPKNGLAIYTKVVYIAINMYLSFRPMGRVVRVRKYIAFLKNYFVKLLLLKKCRT